MTPHDRAREQRALAVDLNDEQALLDAIGGLQSTDDPSLCDLHDQLMARWHELQEQKKASAP